MIVQPPNAWDALAYEFAEWLELLALVRWPNPSGEAELRSFLEGVADDLALFPTADQLEDAVESKVQAVFEELDRRAEWSDGGYPFTLDKGTIRLRTDGAGIETVADSSLAYLFALLATFYRHTYYPSLQKPRSEHDNFPNSEKLEDLFQVCGSIAASGLIEGHSISFGFPRPDGSAFYEKLLAVGKELADGAPKSGWEPGASPNAKDAGVDIIAWRPCPDRLPGQLYVLGQCASGDNWEPGKSPKIDHEYFHEDYWSQEPHSPLVTATFIPFDFRAGVTRMLPGRIEDAWVTERWRLSRSHGIIIDRFRLAHYFASGLRNGQQGKRKVETIDLVPQVKNWIVLGLEFVRG